MRNTIILSVPQVSTKIFLSIAMKERAGSNTTIRTIRSTVTRCSSIIGKVIHIEESDKNRYDDRFELFEEMYQNLEMGYSPENLEYVSYRLMYYLASLKYINQFHEIQETFYPESSTPYHSHIAFSFPTDTLIPTFGSAFGAAVENNQVCWRLRPELVAILQYLFQPLFPKCFG